MKKLSSMNETKSQHELTCPLCSGKDFSQEEGRVDSKWGMSEHKAIMMICNQCGYILFFSKGRTWWVIQG